jgi:hypothetical protein
VDAFLLRALFLKSFQCSIKLGRPGSQGSSFFTFILVQQATPPELASTYPGEYPRLSTE